MPIKRSKRFRSKIKRRSKRSRSKQKRSRSKQKRSRSKQKRSRSKQKRSRSKQKRSRSKVKRSRSKVKRSRSKPSKPCPSGKERNPDTGRCVKIGNIKKKRISSKPCPPKQIRDQNTGKCIPKLCKFGEIDYDGICVKDKAAKYKDCIKRSALALSEAQGNTVKAFNKVDGMLAVHGTGCGKTLTAVAISQCYLDAHPENDVIVISPAVLLTNFAKELSKYGSPLVSNYQFYTYEKFANMKMECKNCLLIIDEAHNLRNYTGKRFLQLMKCAMSADKVLVLTATPVVNSFQDLIPLINLVNKDFVVGPSGMPNIWDQLGVDPHYDVITVKGNEEDSETVKKHLKRKVSFVRKCQGGEFPDFVINKVDIEMSREYYGKYQEALEKDYIFGATKDFAYNRERRAVNMAGEGYFSEKLYKILSYVNGQTIIFSNWIDFGAKVIEKVLKEKGLSYGMITGSVPSADKQQFVKDYNDGKIQVLILSKAGSEGLDLKKTRNVIVLDPPWHPSALEQIIGRAVRRGSHKDLPPEEQNVKVWLAVLTFPPNIIGLKVVSGDEVLYDIIGNKELLVNNTNELLERISICVSKCG